MINQFGRNAQISDFSPDQKYEPSTYQKAVIGHDQRLWKVAITEQLNDLIASSNMGVGVASVEFDGGLRKTIKNVKSIIDWQ